MPPDEVFELSLTMCDLERFRGHFEESEVISTNVKFRHRLDSLINDLLYDILVVLLRSLPLLFDEIWVHIL